MIKTGVTANTRREYAACLGLIPINTSNLKKRRADNTPRSKGKNNETDSEENTISSEDNK